VKEQRNGHRYRRWRQQVVDRSDVCWICLLPLDKRAPYRDPETGLVNPRYPTADHVVPLALGGALLDPANGRASCFECNSRRGIRPLSLPLRTSVDW
jgi:5-methylcytosine-specific restriction endonuclease McrA